MVTSHIMLQEARTRLAAAFGQRLDKVVLYGSYARGDQTPDSDVDLMIVLHGTLRLGADMETAVHALYDRQATWGVPIDIHLASSDAWHRADWGVYRHAHAEGLAA